MSGVSQLTHLEESRPTQRRCNVSKDSYASSHPTKQMLTVRFVTQKLQLAESPVVTRYLSEMSGDNSVSLTAGQDDFS